MQLPLLLITAALAAAYQPSIRARAVVDRQTSLMMRAPRSLVSAVVSAAVFLGGHPALADDIPNVPPYTKKTSQLQTYADVGRGFKMLRCSVCNIISSRGLPSHRPFGFNEFDGAGSGYAVKFASLYDIDENVIVGSAPASAGKESITDYGSLNELGEKLATKRY